jgi:hypothetical protein
MKVNDACRKQFLGGKIGKAVGEKVIKGLVECLESYGSISAETSMTFMPEGDEIVVEEGDCEVILKVEVRRL